MKKILNKKLLFFSLAFFLNLQILHTSVSSSAQPLIIETGHPVLTASFKGWENRGIESPSVLFDNTYKMWYSGHDQHGKKRIGYATSPDGIAWTRYGGNNCSSHSRGNGCVLDIGNNSSWDGDHVYGMSVVMNQNDPEGRLYKMWYTGASNASKLEVGRWRTGFAFSYDGVEWIKHRDNNCPSSGKGQGCVFDTGQPGSWDDVVAAAPSVIIDQDASPSERYKMWYEGCIYNNTAPEHRCRIGYATSPNGIIWTRYSKNKCPGFPKGPGCVFDTGKTGSWDEVRVIQPTVIKAGRIYEMWYAGQSRADNKFRIGYATSSDGITWNRMEHNNCPASPKGHGCMFDITLSQSKNSISDPHVIKVKESLMIWYRIGSSTIGLKNISSH